jgi:hypothetical protein
MAVGSHYFVQMLYTPPGEVYDVQFDLLLAENELQKSAIARRVQRDVPGISRPVYVLHCDDLILFKLVAGRLIDLADAAMLLRENRDEIDANYLTSWATRYGLTDDLARVWNEAHPGEALPGTPT